MPIPKPRSGESQDDYVSRCMADSTMRTDFPQQSQRAAVCMQQWRDRNKDTARGALGFLEQDNCA